ncbi:MAG: hypothetical protein AAF447_08555, partial [Myxococcota bacterium]
PAGARRGGAYMAGWTLALAFGRAGAALEAWSAGQLAGVGAFWGGAVSPALAAVGAALGVALVARSPARSADALAPAALLVLSAVALLDAARAYETDATRFGAETALALLSLALFTVLWRRTPRFLARRGRRATLVTTLVVASSLALDGLRQAPGLELRRLLTGLVALGLVALALRLVSPPRGSLRRGPRAPQRTTA